MLYPIKQKCGYMFLFVIQISTGNTLPGYMTVSLVGLTATGSARSDKPLFVTHATSGAKSSIWVFSRSSALLDTNNGK
jgi:hypothetical protein